MPTIRLLQPGDVPVALLSNVPPSPLDGTSTAGTSTYAARADHNHDDSQLRAFVNAAVASSTVADLRYSGSVTLTTTGATIESGALLSFGVSRSVTGKTAQFLFPSADIWLEPGEILAIRCTAATVIGDSIEGNISWSES